jgi:hypothetical protein
VESSCRSTGYCEGHQDGTDEAGNGRQIHYGAFRGAGLATSNVCYYYHCETKNFLKNLLQNIIALQEKKIRLVKLSLEDATDDDATGALDVSYSGGANGSG